jgi:hypothetical protein
MLLWMLKHICRKGLASQRGVLGLGETENLARSGAAAWLLAQERARLEFLAAKEAYSQSGAVRDLAKVCERLLALNSTNAVVQSLLNEQAIERLLAAPKPDCRPQEPTPLRKTA